MMTERRDARLRRRLKLRRRRISDSEVAQPAADNRQRAGFDYGNEASGLTAKA